ncbi:MAG TPA: hypothetical protein VIU62_22890 [Chloroflexota bacterium]
MNLAAQSKVKQSTLAIVVTRADGRVEDFGTVAYWHRDPMKRILWEACKQANIRIAEADILRYSSLDFIRRLLAGR